MYIDLITPYLPDAATITQAQLLDTRTRWVNYLQPMWPELDMRPSSVFGDLLLSPSAFQWGSAETAMSRFMSDLDLSNVAAGTIYSCDFVTKFLANFAPTDAVYIQSTGMLRLTFADGGGRTLDRSVQFLFGTDVFTMRLACPGPMNILPVGGIPAVNSNSVVLFQAGTSTYLADIPLTGAMTTAILAGAAPSISVTVAGLSAMSALADFSSGSPTAALPSLAQLTRSTFYSATPNTRGGTAMFISRQFPDLPGVSVTISGDVPEMIRDQTGVLGFSDGWADIYASSDFVYTDTQIIRLNYDPTLQKFVGALLLPSIPKQIKSVIPTAATGVTPSIAAGNMRIFAQSGQPSDLPGCQAAYTGKELLWLVVDQQFAPLTGAFLIPTASDATAPFQQYATFTVAYTTDPLLPTVRSTIEAADNAPLGVDVSVRGFIPALINNLTISYVRAAGTSVNLPQAQAEIATYLNGLTYPEIYSDARLYDSMFYAGAKDVVSIACSGGVQWSVANLILPAGTIDTTTTDGSAYILANYSSVLAVAKQPHAISFSNSTSLRVSYRDGSLTTFEAIGPRNTCYVIDPNTITFQEV